MDPSTNNSDTIVEKPGGKSVAEGVALNSGRYDGFLFYVII